MKQTPSKIFLSSQRGRTELSWLRSLHTFNFGNYFDENKQSFAPLLAINDNTLAAGKSQQMTLEKTSDVFILPLIGGLEYRILNNEHDFLEAGKVLHFSGKKNTVFEIMNPYETELINYLEIWIERNEQNLTAQTNQHKIDTEKQNELLCISEGKSFIYFGKYNGRAEGVFHLKKATSKLFAFVIEGAFEFDNKLMESRDGLALWNATEIEYEALSDNAMLLLIEMTD